MKNRKYLVMGAALVATFSIGRFSAPKKVEIREVERVITKENETQDRNQSVVETVTETRRPDGTIVKETKKEKETSVQTQRQRDTSTTKEYSKSVEVRPSWRIGAIIEPAVPGFQSDGYGLIVEKRLFSEFYIGVSGRSEGTFGLTFSFGF